MQIIPVSNYSFGCRFFNKKQKTQTIVINTENENKTSNAAAFLNI